MLKKLNKRMLNRISEVAETFGDPQFAGDVRMIIDELLECYSIIHPQKKPNEIKQTCIEVIDFFNSYCNKNTEQSENNHKVIRDTIFSGTCTPQDFKDVVRMKYDEWHDSVKMAPNISVHVICNKRNFYKYLDQFKNLPTERQDDLRAGKGYTNNQDTGFDIL